MVKRVAPAARLWSPSISGRRRNGVPARPHGDPEPHANGSDELRAARTPRSRGCPGARLHGLLIAVARDRADDGGVARGHASRRHRRAALRSTRSWVVGVDAVYRELKASRHDLFPAPGGSRFIRDFDMPLPVVLTPVS